MDLEEIQKIKKKKNRVYDKMIKYRRFVYHIACNVPDPDGEEGKINKINSTKNSHTQSVSLQHWKFMKNKGYFYVENLQEIKFNAVGCFHSNRAEDERYKEKYFSMGLWQHLFLSVKLPNGSFKYRENKVRNKDGGFDDQMTDEMK